MKEAFKHGTHVPKRVMKALKLTSVLDALVRQQSMTTSKKWIYVTDTLIIKLKIPVKFFENN